MDSIAPEQPRPFGQERDPEVQSVGRQSQRNRPHQLSPHGDRGTVQGSMHLLMVLAQDLQ